MLKGFKEFLARGNIIDLSVAVVIGTAFTGLVTKFTESVIQPLVDRIGAGGKSDVGILKISIGGGQFIDFNVALSAAINFVIIAAVVFLMGLSFVVLLTQLEGGATLVPVTQMFFSTAYFWLIVLLTAPVMRAVPASLPRHSPSAFTAKLGAVTARLLRRMPSSSFVSVACTSPKRRSPQISSAA